MFEVGKRYTFTMVDGPGVTSDQSGTVESYEHPLVKLADVDLTGTMAEPRGEGSKIIRGPIINVASAHFVQATIDDTK